MPKTDPERDEFYMWIGHCISAWAKVEERLFKICWHSLRAPKTQAAIVYFRTPSLDARLSLVDELVKSALPKPERRDGGHGELTAGTRYSISARIVHLYRFLPVEFRDQYARAREADRLKSKTATF
jgi:hypothetical protein